MQIEHTLDISNSPALTADFDGKDEIEIEVDVYITNWDRDSFGQSFIEDLEYADIRIITDDGSALLATGDMESNILELIEQDEDFTAKIYATAKREGEEI